MNIIDLLPYFDIEDVSPDGWPAICNILVPSVAAEEAVPYWPAAAKKGGGRAASGRGTTRAEALVSGLGSAFELASAFRWPDLETVRSKAQALPGEVWTPEEMSGFSEAQVADASQSNDAMFGVDEIVRSVSDELNWVAAVGLEGQRIWVPADTVYLGADRTEAIATSDTNGCAAGQTPNAARSAALFELIERDATGRWWYGKRPRPAIDPRELDDEAAKAFQRCRDAGLDPVLANITSDLDIPSVAAIGSNPEGHIAVGFASARGYSEAAHRALTEMAQMYLVIRHGFAGAELRPGLETWLTQVSPATSPICCISPDPAGLPPEPDSLGSRLSDAGIRLAFIDLTRPEFGVPVWRALSPDLCHWKPRFGRPRLLQQDRFDLGLVSMARNEILLRL